MKQTLNRGVIIRGVAGRYVVKDIETGKTLSCSARGVFRKREETPLVGDFVMYDPKERLVAELLPRSNSFIRPRVANVDVMVILLSAELPEPDFTLMDKLLVFCALADVRPIVAVNKCDAGIGEELREELQYLPCPVCYISAQTGEGIAGLKAELGSGVAVLAGQSGVGKSSTVNRLLDNSVMEIGELSEKLGRGKNTTRHVELLDLGEGLSLIDTPGFSSMELADLEPERIKLCYEEFDEYRGGCRFSDCNHVAEPDCAVRAAAEAGLINARRYERYVTIFKRYAAMEKRYD